jgi:methylmalonyl-CoA mutase C-terminal domain/subunit
MDMISNQKKIRVLLCKPPLDMHSRGLLVVARALRDAGMEVVYLEASPRRAISEILETAVQEDVDIIGLSILSGSPIVILSKMIALRNQKGISEIPVIVGGIVPKEEVEELKNIGVTDIFPPGTSTEKIIEAITDLIGKKKG